MMLFILQCCTSGRWLGTTQGNLQSLSQYEEDSRDYCSFIQSVVAISANYRSTLFRDLDSHHVGEVIVEVHQHSVHIDHSQVSVHSNTE